MTQNFWRLLHLFAVVAFIVCLSVWVNALANAYDINQFIELLSVASVTYMVLLLYILLYGRN